MAQLIIGHTTDTTARIWVQGDKCRSCEVSVEPAPPSAESQKHTRLYSERDYTGIVYFRGLQPNTKYTVQATFSPDRGRVSGTFRTMAGQDGEPLPFSFVLSSCNLSVVSINNLLAYLLAAAGTSAAVFSLDIPPDRWKLFGFIWLRRLLRWPLQRIVRLVAGVVNKTTGIKQPAPPYLRSPFLKLTAVFESQLLDIHSARKSLPAVGDIIFTSSANGVLACSATRRPGGCRLVVTQVEGKFNNSEIVHSRAAGDPPGKIEGVGIVRKCWHGLPWYDNPSFFMHAGDQIYYDFPDETRPPRRNDYRLAYREAWSDDSSNRYLLAHWPHYMTLDDHEIADQFARDFTPPAQAPAENYLREATVAYREYVHARNPAPENVDRSPGEPYWYCFDKGRARFFVLDTRMKRSDRGTSDGPSQIIDDVQMTRLLSWMTQYKDDLKFVVTSVPFVAQIDESSTSLDWYARNRSPAPDGSAPKPPNPANDKWSADRFKRQRDEIIAHIANNCIEHLIFLTGDMHCCYHATMRIGTGSKYECTTVHELAGGPANQLQLASGKDFIMRHRGHTAGGIDYDIVLDRFHSEVNAVMHLKVVYPEQEQFLGSSASVVPEVEWNVIRTLTDSGSAAWADDTKTGDGPTKSITSAHDKPVRAGEPTMTGRISFVRKRKPSELLPWPRQTDGAAARHGN